MRDLVSNIDFKPSLVPQTINASFCVTGANGGVDLLGYESAMVCFNVGTLTDGTWTPKLQESDDNTTFTDVAAADQLGTLSALVTLVDQRVGYRGVKRYLRGGCTLTSSGGTGIAIGVFVVRGNPAHKPLA